MANGSVLSNGQSHERKRGGPEEEPKPDVARLAALAQHLNPESDASDQANGNVRKHPPEPIGPAIHGSPDAPKNNLVKRDRRSFGARIFRSVTRFFIVALIGAGVTLGWQSHGEEAKQMVRAQARVLVILSTPHVEQCGASDGTQNPHLRLCGRYPRVVLPTKKYGRTRHLSRRAALGSALVVRVGYCQEL